MSVALDNRSGYFQPSAPLPRRRALALGAVPDRVTHYHRPTLQPAPRDEPTRARLRFSSIQVWKLPRVVNEAFSAPIRFNSTDAGHVQSIREGLVTAQEYGLALRRAGAHVHPQHRNTAHARQRTPAVRTRVYLR